MVDNNPTSNYIVCPTWTVGKVHDWFFINLGRYFHALVGSGVFVPQFIRNNPIGPGRALRRVFNNPFATKGYLSWGYLSNKLELFTPY
jgi:hypothetical protein